MKSQAWAVVGFATALLTSVTSTTGGTLAGHVRDPNWFAVYQNNPAGVGYYEYAVNANAAGAGGAPGADDTDVFGAFQMGGLSAGRYAVASWDVWWRSAYAFDVDVPGTGSSADADVRLRATMWGYPAFWDDTGYHEFGQTFVASGPVSMIYLRSPSDTAWTLSVHANGPGGASVGEPRTFSGRGDRRLVYGYGQMPLIAGETYYARVRAGSGSATGVLRQMDPRPDNSDPMPGGCLWLGDGTTLTPYPDRDLGLIIMSDDDGLVTDLFARRSGSSFSGMSSIGQTFVARGVGLISAAFWLADPSGPTYSVRVLAGGPGGQEVGTRKLGRVARLTADPEMLVVWAPGECPLTPGQTYYVEVTRQGGGVFNEAYVNRTNPFPFGDAFRDGTLIAGVDLAGTLMEEASVGSATLQEVKFVVDPAIAEQERGATYVTVRWQTDVPSDSLVEYAVDHPPYTEVVHDPALTTAHAVTLNGLTSQALFHYRVKSTAAGKRDGVFRDQAALTRAAGSNLLVNGGFEEGASGSPRDVIPGWSKGGVLDVKASDGSWFSGIPSWSGNWLLQGAVNGGDSDGYIYQRVDGLTSGTAYRFSGWVTTWHRENGAFKYDVWNDPGRLIYVQLGLDPGGGTDPSGASVVWTPRIYSHLEYSPAAVAAEAEGSSMTVFVRMTGKGGEWHLYGVDECTLTPAMEEREATLYEGFDVMPAWDSIENEPASAAATFSITAFGQNGGGLQATRSEPGSSVRVKRFSVEPNERYLVSVYARSPGASFPYTAECAARAGAWDALDYIGDGAGWTVVQRFANPGANGSTNRWAQFWTELETGAETELSVGFKLESEAGGTLLMRWDELRVDPMTLPQLEEAILEDAGLRVTFSEAVDPVAAALLMNYALIPQSGGVATPVVTAVEVLNPISVRLTVALVPGADYEVTARDVGRLGVPSVLTGSNGAVPVRLWTTLIGLDAGTLWKYEQSGSDLGTAWSGPEYDDSGWLEGPGLLADETASLPEPVRTPLTVSDGKLTFYFRHGFNLPAAVSNAPARLWQVVDDGVVYYLNGTEIFRLGVDAMPARYSDLASRVVGDAVYEGPFDIPAVTLVSGSNWVAAEVHQQGPTSSDVVFGARWDVLVPPSLLGPPPRVWIERDGDGVVLWWDGVGGVLESAEHPMGPWSALPGRTSPASFRPSEPEWEMGAAFFRVVY